jgi:hypothetical protein
MHGLGLGGLVDSRFVRRWNALRKLKEEGEEPFDAVLARMPSADLVEALAGAACGDGALANAVATEVLNRVRRARFLGAGVAAVVIALAIFPVDAVLTGTWGTFGAGLALVSILALASSIAAVSFILASAARKPRRVAVALVCFVLGLAAVPVDGLVSGQWRPLEVALGVVSLAGFSTGLVILRSGSRRVGSRRAQ